MNEPCPNRSSKLILLFILALGAAFAFAALWLRELGRKPAEFVRNVAEPSGVAKEIPVDKIREVPARLTDAQQRLIDFAGRFLSAPILTEEDDVLYKLDSINVQVHLNDAVKKAVSEERVRNKFELILRKHNIRFDDHAPARLVVDYEGLWDENEVVLTYAPRMRLQQWVTIDRNGDFRRTVATVWQRGAYGFAGKTVAQESILNNVEENAESFANKYLSVQEKQDKIK